MRSVLEELYMLELDNEVIKVKSRLELKEEKTYDELRKSLNKRQRELFDEFVELISDRLAARQEETYKWGFRSATILIKELIE
ncbi:MAG: hypothetical protein E7340_01510 [Clostridiales bacterium]|nr:hypothetical protein [Clostridiales bacterium]